MASDAFSALCDDLGKILKIRTRPNRGNTMLIRFRTGIELRLEQAPGNNIIVATTCGKPPPTGRYRENLLREALKANGLPAPRTGFFAYSTKQEALVLSDHLPMDELSAQKLADFLGPFMQKAEMWKNAIEHGEIPSFTGVEASFGKSAAGGIFGLIK